ncbi:MAG: hpch/hpai aldolase [Deltaproteobacteria bacterium]|nr:hpch/hpai aldolase [Deltaproteobacteria bacterium]
MALPSFRRLLETKELSVGIFICEFTTPGIGHIIKAAGCDFAFVDMEHAALGYETVKRTLRCLHDTGVASLVRPPSKHYHHISRACDVGAQGIMPPMLSTAEEARNIVRYMKYPPLGERGVALGIAHDDYRSGAIDEKFADANEKTCLVALIETAEGIENIEEIASVDGVDCLWIGHFDLSCSLGIPGQFDHADFQRAVDRVVAAGIKYNKALGRLVPTVQQGVELFEKGFNMIVYSSEVRLLQQALAEGIERLRSQCRSASE